MLQNQQAALRNRQIGEAIMANGGESYIAYAGRNAEYPSNSKLVRIGSKFDSYFHATLSRIFDNQRLLSYFATKKIIKEVECINPDSKRPSVPRSTN